MPLPRTGRRIFAGRTYFLRELPYPIFESHLLVMMVAVGVARLVGVVVRRRGGADFLLEAG